MKFSTSICIVLSVTFAVLISSCIRPGDQELLTIAIEQEINWKLTDAIETLEGISNKMDPHYLDLTVRLLLKTGSLSEASTILHNLPDTLLYTDASLLHSAAMVNFYLGELDQSLLYANQLHKLGVERQDSLLIAHSHHIKGRIAFNNGRFDEAMNYQKKSLFYSESAGSLQAIGDIMRQIGVLEWYKSNHHIALQEYLEPALILYNNADDKMGEASTLANIGLIKGEMGDPLESVNYNLRALHIRHTIGDLIGLADSFYFLSNVISISGFDGIFPYLMRTKSLELSLKSGYSWGISVASRALLADSYGATRFDAARKEHLDSLSSQLGDGHLYYWQEKAREAIEKKQFDQAITFAKHQISIFDSLRFDAGLIHSHRILGEAFLNNSQPLFALEHLSIAKNLIDESGSHFTEPVVNFYLTQAKYETGNQREAISQLDRQINEMDYRHMSYINQSESSLYDYSYLSYLNLRKEMYETYAFWMLNNGNEELVFDVIDRMKSNLYWWMEARKNRRLNHDQNITGQNLIDIFNQYLKGNPNQDELDKLINSVTELIISDRNQILNNETDTILSTLLDEQLALSINAIQSRKNSGSSSENTSLDVADIKNTKQLSNEKYIHFLISGDTIISAVKSQEGVLAIKMPSSTTDIINVTETYHRLLLRGKSNPTDTLWKAPSKYLFNVLIRPLEDTGIIRSGDHLYISPDDILTKVPFQSLLVSRESNTDSYLIEDYTITSFLTLNQLKMAEVDNNAGLDYDQTRESPDLRNISHGAAFAPNTKQLLNTKSELLNISTVFENMIPYVDQEASKTAFMEELPQAQIIHFAGHVTVDPFSPYNSSMSFSTGQFSLFETLSVRTNAVLVVLSACETGNVMVSNTIRENTTGFARAFIFAGAENVLVSHWIVEDSSTADLMGFFYKSLAQNPYSNQAFDVKISNALREAQLIMIKNHARNISFHIGTETSENHENSQLLHPFYWAAFSHVRGR